MLCPEICNFAPPKTMCSVQRIKDNNHTLDRINKNCFYRSVILTCPDEINIPNSVQETLLEDSNYYKIFHCTITEFMNPLFINTFVKKGKLYCMSILKNCINNNGFSITPEGLITLHVLSSVYQSLGIEGTKYAHDFYEITLNLHDLKTIGRLRNALKKLEKFDVCISWEPYSETVCPSTIAKYFSDINYKVTEHSLVSTILTPDIKEIPSLDADIGEIVEWMGMLAHNADLVPKENYVSTYNVPESSDPLQTTRVSVMVVKGFITSNIICRVAHDLSQYVSIRGSNNYWSALSMQTVEESLYQWHPSAPRIFQSHNSSTNIFFTCSGVIIYSVGQIKYS